MTGKAPLRVLLAGSILAWLSLRVAALFSTAFNWDELVLFDRAASSLADGLLRGGGHGSLSELLVAPLLAGCQDEIAAGRWARGMWTVISLVYLGGIAMLLAELLRGRPQRGHDMALGVALLALLPVFVEWSLQVRTDHLAAAGGVWGGTWLLASRRRPLLAVPSGLAFALGWLSSQKLAYLALLMLCLEVGRLLLALEWRPRRELLRAALLAVTVLAVTAGYRAGLELLFTVPAGHPTSPLPEAGWVASYLDLFGFYRNTIGYSQHQAVLPSLAPHAVLVAGLLIASGVAWRRRCVDPRVVLAWGVLALGVAVGLFHAAAFSYFWITLGLFPAIALALAAGPVRDLLPNRWRAPAVASLWCALALPGLMQSVSLLDDSQTVQRESLRFVHRNFVPDAVGFHPEMGVFCSEAPPRTRSAWLSQTIYLHFGSSERERSVLAMKRRFRRDRVQYLVNSFRLNQFPVELRRFWDEHYQPYRASVFVAGRRLQGHAGESSDFELLVPGTYRWLPLEGPQTVHIDDRPLAPGATVVLDAALHRVAFPEDVSAGVLVLALKDPPGPAPLAFYKQY